MNKLIQKLKNHPLLIILIFAFLLLTIGVNLYLNKKDTVGVPLDDAYIHFQFSKNISEGNGFSYNSGTETPGSTSPLWTMLLSFFYNINNDQIITSLILSCIFELGTLIVIYLIVYKRTGNKLLSFFTSSMLLFTGRFLWASGSGMEITFYSFLISLIILFNQTNKNSLLISLFIGISVLIRPESYLIFFFFLISRFFYYKKISKIFLLETFFNILIFLIIALPYIIFCLKTTGNLFPNTFFAQNETSSDFISTILYAGKYLFRYIYLILMDNPLLGIFLPFSVFQLIKNKNINSNIFILLITFGFPLFSSFLAPNLRHHGRYIIPFIPIYYIFAFSSFEYWKKLKIIKHALILILFLYMFFMQYIWLKTLSANINDINRVQVTVGKWVDNNINKNEIIALNDIGAITYYSDNKIFDTVGLVSPEILEKYKGQTKQQKEEILWNYIKEKKFDYIIILPSWYPNISKKSELEEKYRVKLDNYSIVDDDMVIYEVNL